MRKILIFTVFTILCIRNQCTAQIEFSGQCQNLPVVSPFDVQKYLGTWFEIEKYPARFEKGGKCIYAIYSDNHNGTIQVRNTRIITETNKYSEIIGSARFADPSKNEGKLLVKFPVPGNREGDYWVMSTDYVSYTIVWGCTQKGDKNYQFLWHLSRTRNPEQKQRELVRGLMENLTLDTSGLVTTDQTNCPSIYSIL